jgi:type I restriction enzyme M protein
MLPMTVLRRFDCVLEPTKQAVLKRHARLKDSKVKNFDPILNDIAKDAKGNALGFHNHSELDFQKLKGDPDNIGRHLVAYIEGFSENVKKIFERFEFEKEIEKLEESNRLYLVVSKFAEVDLHPHVVDNIAMGVIFEDLIRRFNEAANETAGDHFTPREVIRLMVNLLLEPDSRILTTKGVITTVCDPTCGTGGMLAETQNWIRDHNPDARVMVFGQDYNPRSYAVAASDLLIKGHREGRVEFGNTLINDKFKDEKFDYLLANPPYGVDWKAEQDEISKWSDYHGYKGKLPRVNDGALMFLLTMIGKFQPVDPEQNKHGTRIGIVFNGSPMFTGGAGGGESEIRRWIIEQDWLEAIVALPEQMFYNTGIGTYIWIVTNRKAKSRKGKIQLIDSRDRWAAMRRSLGDKRRYLTDEIIADLTREHGAFKPADTCKIFDNEDFGYRRITIDRPLRLRFQITDEAKGKFLDACPDFLDAVKALEAEYGPDKRDDWSTVWPEIQRIAETAGAEWTTPSKRLFRSLFTKVEPTAKPVIAKRGDFSGLVSAKDFPRQKLPAHVKPDALDVIFGVYPATGGKKAKTAIYEADPDLKDFENVPLKEDIVSFFLRETRPFFPDAWVDPETKDEQDGGIGKVGYEINFNREFFCFEKPRSLEAIDAELKKAEEQIFQLLKEVTA